MADRRTPPDSDFEWSEAPVRPSRLEPDTDTEAFNTGERDSFKEVPRSDPAAPPKPKGPSVRERVREKRRERSERRQSERAERNRRSREERRHPAKRPPPTGRRPRRADLPAKVRRRQDFAVGAVVVAGVAGVIALLSGGGTESGGLGVPLNKLVGQTIVGKMGPGGPDKRMLQQVRSGRLGNLVVLPHDENSLRADISRVQKAAREGGNPPLLIVIAQEGGYVKQLPGPPNMSPSDLGKSGDQETAKQEGQATGSFLAGLGVNVNLAPLLDVTLPKTADTVASRTYGSDEEDVAKVGLGFIQGLQASGVAATAKHFPGLGLSTEDTDFARADVQATEAEQNVALSPFKTAIDGGVDLVMVSTAIYPNLGSQQPAALSSAIVTGQLRQTYGFRGPIITDDLEGLGVTAVTSSQQAAVQAIRAGADLLLFAHEVRTAGTGFQAVTRAVQAGRLDQGAVEGAYERVLALKHSLANRAGG